MKQKIINYVMFLMLISCSVIPVIWAGPEDQTTTIIPPEFNLGVAMHPSSDIKPNNLKKDNINPKSKVSGAARLGFKSSGHWFMGQIVILDLYAYNLQDARKFRMDVKYNPKQLRLVSVSRGAFLVEDQGMAEWKNGDIEEQNGLIAAISGIRQQSFSGEETTLVQFNFIVTGVGSGEILLENPKIVSAKGIERGFEFTPLEYQIEREK